MGNMPINKKGRVTFTTTLFALIRDNLKINVRESAEMDQADMELRATIMKVWPITRAGKIDLLVPPDDTTGAGKLTVGKLMVECSFTKFGKQQDLATLKF